MPKNCRACSRATLVSNNETHRYIESGLPNVLLVGVELRRCRVCGHCELVLPRVSELHRIIAEFVSRNPLGHAELRVAPKPKGWETQVAA